jgi:hypothetical protein
MLPMLWIILVFGIVLTIVGFVYLFSGKGFGKGDKDLHFKIEKLSIDISCSNAIAPFVLGIILVIVPIWPIFEGKVDLKHETKHVNLKVDVLFEDGSYDALDSVTLSYVDEMNTLVLRDKTDSKGHVDFDCPLTGENLKYTIAPVEQAGSQRWMFHDNLNVNNLLLYPQQVKIPNSQRIQGSTYEPPH